MLNKTALIKKIIFFPAVIVSSLMTAILFYQFGSTLPTKIIFIVIGISIQVYQIYSLLEWKNSKFRNKKNYFAATRYIVITLSSCIATIAFGIKEIEKQTVSQSGNVVRIQTIDALVKDKEKTLVSLDKTADNIKAQIETIRKQIPRLTYHIEARTTALNYEISKLRKTVRGISKKNMYEEIEKLRIERSKLKVKTNNKKGAFDVMAGIFGVTTNVVMLGFLMFITISLESMIYSTSANSVTAPSSKARKGKAKKKKANQNQLDMWKGQKVDFVKPGKVS